MKKAMFTVIISIQATTCFALMSMDSFIGFNGSRIPERESTVIVEPEETVIEPLLNVTEASFDFNIALGNLDAIAGGDFGSDAISQGIADISEISQDINRLNGITDIQYSDFLNTLENISLNREDKEVRDLKIAAVNLLDQLPQTYAELDEMFNAGNNNEDAVAGAVEDEIPSEIEAELQIVAESRDASQIAGSLQAIQDRTCNTDISNETQAAIISVLQEKFKSLESENVAYKSLTKIIRETDGATVEQFNQILKDVVKALNEIAGNRPSVEDNNLVEDYAYSGAEAVEQAASREEEQEVIVSADAETEEAAHIISAELASAFVDTVANVYERNGNILNSETRFALVSAMSSIFESLPDTEAGVNAYNEIMALAENADEPADVAAVLRVLDNLMTEFGIDESLRNEIASLVPAITEAEATVRAAAFSGDTEEVNLNMHLLAKSPEANDDAAFTSARQLQIAVAQAVEGQPLDRLSSGLALLGNPDITAQEREQVLANLGQNLSVAPADVQERIGYAFGELALEYYNNAQADDFDGIINGLIVAIPFDSRDNFSRGVTAAVSGSPYAGEIAEMLEINAPSGISPQDTELPGGRNMDVLPIGALSAAGGLSGSDSELEGGLLNALRDMQVAGAITQEDIDYALSYYHNTAITDSDMASLYVACGIYMLSIETETGVDSSGLEREVNDLIKQYYLAGNALAFDASGQVIVAGERAFVAKVSAAIDMLNKQGYDFSHAGQDASGVETAGAYTKVILPTLSLGAGGMISEWMVYLNAFSPQAIIKEILKKLEPKKTEETAKLKMAFPDKIPAAQFLFIFLCLIVFASTFGYSAGKYYLRARQ